MPFFGGRSRGAQLSYERRERLKAEGLVPVRLLLLTNYHRMITDLRDRYQYDNLGTTIDAFIVKAAQSVNLAALTMPRRHSASEHHVECNVMISQEGRDALDRIKKIHGLSRYYALEALLAMLPDPWAIRSRASEPDTTTEIAVSG